MELENKESQQTQPAKQPSTDSTASPRPAATRCQARSRNGSRCRLRAQHPGTPLCRRHADRAGTFSNDLDDSLDLSDDIFAVDQPRFETVEGINAVLSNIVILVARGRISIRRAAVMTYGLSLMLRSVVVMDRQAANAPYQYTFDRSSPTNTKDEPAASAEPNAASKPGANTHPDPASNPNAYPQTTHEALENYARRRT
jgi:hypothetical protein